MYSIYRYLKDENWFIAKKRKRKEKDEK